MKQLSIVESSKELFDIMPSAIFWKDSSGKYLGANPQFLKCIKVENLESLIGKTDFEILPPSIAKQFYDIDKKVLNGETYSDTGFSFEKWGSDYYHVKTKKVPLYEGDKIVGLLGVFQDIKQDECKILDEYKRGHLKFQKQILEGTSDAIIVVDKNSKSILFMNKIASDFLANTHSKKEKDLFCFDFSWGKEKEDNLEDVSNFITQYFVSCDKYFVMHFKEIEWENSNNAYVRYLSDITDIVKKRTENKTSREQLDMALTSSSMPYFEYSYQDRCLYCSEFAQEFFNLPLRINKIKDFVYENKLVHSDDFEIFAKSIDGINQRKMDDVEMELRIYVPSKKEYSWFDIKVSNLYDDRQNCVKAFITFNDLNRYKSLEKRFTAILNSNDIETWEYDLKEDKIYYSYYFSNGYENGIKSKALIDLVHPRDLPQFKAMINKLKKGFDNANSEYRLKGVNGWSWYHTEMTRLRNIKGKGSRAIVSARNIDKIKLAEKKYKEELSFQKIVNSNYIMYGLLNLSRGKVVYCSGKLIFDSSMKDCSIEVFFESLSSLIILDNDKKEWQVFCDIDFYEKYKLGQIEDSKIFQILVEDKIRFVKISHKLLENPETNDLMCFFYGEDVDLNVKTDNLMQAALDTTFDFFSNINLITDEVIVCSSKNSIFPFSKEREIFSLRKYLTLIRKTVQLPLIFDLREEKRKIIDNLKEKEYHISVHKFTNEKGAEVIKRAKICYLNKEKFIVGTFWDDITEIHKENERRNKELADALNLANAANSSKTRFLSAMSHDIRTPLNAIIGMNKIALESQSNPEQINESLNVIQSSSEHLLTLINDILDMSKIESNKIVFCKEPFDISKEFSLFLKRMQVLANKKNQNLEYKENIIHPFVYGDKSRVFRVIENVVNNSIKFSPKESTVNISLKEILSVDKKYCFLNITISDIGIGMSKEDLARIFSPFFRSSNVEKLNIEGTGLGLAISKRIIDALGGTFTIKSKLNKGTTSVIEIPFERVLDIEVIKDSTTENIREYNYYGEKILLVEDNKVNLLVARKILEKMGFEITSAANGQIGLDTFKQSDVGYFDFIITDIQMPVMDGYQLTTAVKGLERKDAKSIPIIAMTANAFVEDVRKSLSLGMAAHITKPIDKTELIRVLSLFSKTIR